MNKRDWMYLIIIIVLGVSVVSIYGYMENSDIRNNLSVTSGKINFYGRTTKGGTVISYEYYHKYIKYQSSSGIGYFKDCEKTGWCIGKCFKVEYSSKNPKNSRMNFDKPCDCDSLIIHQDVVITADKE